jgi:hypothetical protein
MANENANQIIFYLNRDGSLIDIVLRSPQGSEEGLPLLRGKTACLRWRMGWSSADSKSQPVDRLVRRVAA